MTVKQEALGAYQATVNVAEIEEHHPRENEGVLLETTVLERKARISNLVVPYTLEIPTDTDELVDTRIVGIDNGYGGKQFGYEELRHQIAGRGLAAFSMHPFGFQHLMHEFSPADLRRPEKRPSQATWGVIKDIRHNSSDYPQIDTSQFHIAGHSMGFKVATTLALHKPGTVATLTNIEGVGCDGHNLSAMAKRVPPFVLKELLPRLANPESVRFSKGWLHILRSEIDYFFPNVPRAFADGVMAATADNRPALRHLKRTQNIGMFAIVGGLDNLISAQGTVDKSWGLFDQGVVLEDQDHLGPIFEASEFAEALTEMIAEYNRDIEHQAA